MRESWVALLVEKKAISKFDNAMFAMVFWTPPEALKKAREKGIPISEGAMICEDGKWRVVEGAIEVKGTILEMGEEQAENLRKCMIEASQKPDAIVVIQGPNGMAFKFTREQILNLSENLMKIPLDIGKPMGEIN